MCGNRTAKSALSTVASGSLLINTLLNYLYCIGDDVRCMMIIQNMRDVVTCSAGQNEIDIELPRRRFKIGTDNSKEKQ